jgi:signal peptidase II
MTASRRGQYTRLGLITAAVACALDQASKLWLIFVYELGRKGPVEVFPFLDLVLTYNTGISYGWFKQEGPLGQWLLLGVKAAAIMLLTFWLTRAQSWMLAFGLGLIVGGALGNAIDRLVYGAVADFELLHLTTERWSFNWYVFNLADTAIVAGVAAILYDSIQGERAAKVP